MERRTGDQPVGHSELVDRIRAEIERGGPITFERFMSLALYEPELGYYAAQASAPNRSLADFQTSPQVHAAFGDLIAGELLLVWHALGRPRPFIVVEPGAGDGTLARHVLAGLAERIPDLTVEYHGADVRLRGGDPSAQLSPPGLAAASNHQAFRRWPNLDVLARSDVKAHCVVSNEFFDALPFHRVCWLSGQLRELYVRSTDAGFVEQIGPASAAALDAWGATGRPDPPEGWRGEVCSALDPVIRSIAGLVERGVVLSVDYGYGDDLSDVATPGDSLVAYHRHQWSEDIYRRVGEQDLTSHVDFRAFLRIGRRYGCEPAGALSQRDFLLGRGLVGDVEKWANRETTAGRKWQARFALTELVKMDGLGKLRVVAQQRGVDSYRLSATPSFGSVAGR